MPTSPTGGKLHVLVRRTNTVLQYSNNNGFVFST